MAILRCIVLGLVTVASLQGATGERFRSAPPPASSPSLVSPQAIYAAFTLNLTHFITWPEGVLGSAGTPLLIGTFPRDPINEQLDEAARGEVVDGHPVRTMRIQSLDDLGKCQVVFISKSVPNRA